MSERGSSDPGGPIHQPVMLREVLQFLDLQPNLSVVDGTVGAGGHSAEIFSRLQPSGRLIGFDRDPMMLRFAKTRLAATSATLVHDTYANLPEQLDALGLTHVDRILVDLGLSSDQLADRDRGFGFQAGGSLDLRFDPTSGRSAADFIRTCAASDLADVLRRYSDEKFAERIAEAVCQERRRAPIRTTQQLVDVVASAVPRTSGSRHPATRTLQALRIVVNQELEHLQRALDEGFPKSLESGGRLVVISFHSIEDRMVKQTFRKRDQWQNLTQKPIQASPAEIRMNPRARSAKLRAAVRI